MNSFGIAEMVEDSVAGAASVPVLVARDRVNLTNVNGTLYFGANDGLNSTEMCGSMIWYRRNGRGCGSCVVASIQAQAVRYQASHEC